MSEHHADAEVKVEYAVERDEDLQPDLEVGEELDDEDDVDGDDEERHEHREDVEARARLETAEDGALRRKVQDGQHGKRQLHRLE